MARPNQKLQDLLYDLDQAYEDLYVALVTKDKTSTKQSEDYIQSIKSDIEELFDGISGELEEAYDQINS